MRQRSAGGWSGLEEERNAGVSTEWEEGLGVADQNRVKTGNVEHGYEVTHVGLNEKRVVFQNGAYHIQHDLEHSTVALALHAFFQSTDDALSNPPYQIGRAHV